jgi:hypothetical protein
MEDKLPLALVAIATIVLAWVLSRNSQKAREPSARDRLLRLCLGDRALMKRLLAREVTLHPGISLKEAALRAIDSLRRDSASPRLKSLDEMPTPRLTWRERYFRARTKWRQSSLSMYLPYMIQVALFVLAAYWIARLFGVEMTPENSGTQ